MADVKRTLIHVHKLKYIKKSLFEERYSVKNSIYLSMLAPLSSHGDGLPFICH